MVDVRLHHRSREANHEAIVLFFVFTSSGFKWCLFPFSFCTVWTGPSSFGVRVSQRSPVGLFTALLGCLNGRRTACIGAFSHGMSEFGVVEFPVNS
jgi:hypothetical protein